jgi:hypothetical protein
LVQAMKAPRVDPSPVVERRLRRYFGGKRCVVTGNDLDAEWHHLDDDPSHSTFANLLPLSSSLNRHLRDLRNRATAKRMLTMSPRLGPRYLERTARNLFDLWDVARSYGCARLAFFVLSSYLRASVDETIPVACQALYYARHRLDYDLLTDVLTRDIAPVIQSASKLSPETAAALFREFAGLYSDHGRPQEAEELYVSLRSLPTSSSRLISDPVEYGALLRREAMTLGARGERIQEVLSRLRDAEGVASGRENLSLSIVNTLVWLLFARGEFKMALAHLEPYYATYRRAVWKGGPDLEPVAVSPWNIAELDLNYGIALANVRPHGWKRSAAEATQVAKQVYEASGAHLFELHPGFRTGVLSDLDGDLFSAILPWQRPDLPVSIDRVVKEVAARVLSVL